MTAPTQTLIVEDDDSFAALIAEILEVTARADNQFTVSRATSVADGEAWLAAQQAELILLDLTLPDSNGRDTYHRIRAAAPAVPIVILSGIDDEELAVDLVQQGAQDYLVKSQIGLSMLQRSLRYALERHRLWRTMQEQTARAEARELNFRALIAGYHDGMIVTDLAHRVYFVNPAAEQMLGMSAATLRQQPLPDPPAPGDCRELRLATGAGESTLLEMRCLHTDWEGEPALLFSLHDVTALHEAESQLRALADDLEKRVEARTIELATTNTTLQWEITERRRVEDELRQAIDRLARSNIELERFAYIASHDLREPLRLIINYCDLLRKRYCEQLDRPAQTYIQFAIDGASRLYEMISSLLEYSRLNVHASQFEETDCNRLLAKVVEELRLGIEEVQATVDWQELPTLQANEVLLMQVFQNLIANAIKFRGDRPPHIQISAESIDHGWRFAVRDNGIGMPPDQADRIFQIFQRLHRSQHYPGAGIGLAVCKKIVLHHGGDIWVESVPDQGSTFYFTVADAAVRERVKLPVPQP